MSDKTFIFLALMMLSVLLMHTAEGRVSMFWGGNAAAWAILTVIEGVTGE